MSEHELDTYLDDMAKSGTWGDGNILSAAAILYKRPVAVTTPDGHTQNVGLPNSISPTQETVLHLGLVQNNHYVSINKSHISNFSTGELTKVICNTLYDVYFA